MTNFISNMERNDNEKDHFQKSDNKIKFNSNGNAKNSIHQQYNYTLTWKRQTIIRHNSNE